MDTESLYIANLVMCKLAADLARHKDENPIPET